MCVESTGAPAIGLTPPPGFPRSVLAPTSNIVVGLAATQWLQSGPLHQPPPPSSPFLRPAPYSACSGTVNGLIALFLPSPEPEPFFLASSAPSPSSNHFCLTLLALFLSPDHFCVPLCPRAHAFCPPRLPPRQSTVCHPLLSTAFPEFPSVPSVKDS